MDNTSGSFLGDPTSSRTRQHIRHSRLHREESMLKHKASILENFLRNWGEEKPVEQRCEILRERIEAAQEQLAQAGKLEAARKCLETPSDSEFKVVKRGEFLRWLSDNDSSTTTPPADEIDFLAGTNKRSNLGDVDFIVDGDVLADGDSVEVSLKNRSKRRRVVDKEIPPCLRCRILKKRCDGFEICSHCPTQSYKSESDFWKVLGCYRGRLRDLSRIFCPDFSRSIQRTLEYKTGGFETINFVLTKSRVSESKRRRISHLVHTRHEFKQLTTTSWEDVTIRESVSRSATAFTDLDRYDDIFLSRGADLEDYEAAWSILQAVSMDRTYLKKTEYNFFTLIQLGNSFSREDQAQWDLFAQAKRILRQSVELYLLERLCGQIASGDLISPPPFDPTRTTANTLVLVDPREDVEIFLRKFERVCSGRAKLTGSAQLACFYALLTFGIAKSMLIDAYSIRDKYEKPSPWSEAEAAKIISAYKGLVSVFCRSSRSDLIIKKENDDQDPGNPIGKTHALVKSFLWKKRGYKGTKDFLLCLGSCFHPDGCYNGFFIQRFGLEEVPKLTAKSSKKLQVNSNYEIGSDCEASGQLLSNMSTRPGSSSASEMMHIFKIATNPSPKLDVQDGNLSDEPSSSPSTNYTLDSPNHAIISETINALGVGGYSTITFIAQKESDVQGSKRLCARRNGALDPATQKKAREIRKLGACWNCWVLKMPCSEGSVCERCQKKDGTPIQARYPPKHSCSRAPFTAWTDLIFPDFLIAPYTTEAMDVYIAENTGGWKDEIVDIEVLWGGLAPMRIIAYAFIPGPKGKARLPYKGPNGELLRVDSLPIGLIGDKNKVLEDLNLQRLESIIHSSTAPMHYNSTSYVWHDSEFLNSLQRIIAKFYKTMPIPDPLIHDLLLLCAATQSIQSPIILTQESATKVLDQLDIKKSDANLYSSRLLNLQIKKVTYDFARRTTTSALGQLEKLMRGRDRAMWPVCFAAMLLLFISMEEISVLTHAHMAAVRVAEDPLAGLENEPDRSFQELYDMAYVQLKDLFHALYRTTKANSASGINPFINDCQNELGFDDSSMAFVEDIKELLNVDRLTRNRPSHYGSEMDDVARRRLVWNFLWSFDPMFIVG